MCKDTNGVRRVLAKSSTDLQLYRTETCCNATKVDSSRVRNGIDLAAEDEFYSSCIPDKFE